MWRALDLVPVSAYHEVFEAYHKTGVGTDGDWKSILQQMLRCGLAFTFSGVVGTSIATDGLFGVGDRVTSKVNIGALKKGYVNIAVHGHLPLLVKDIVKAGQSEKFVEPAKCQGAKGIRFYDICCSDLSAMYRYAGVIPPSNAVSAELVLGTGALDSWGRMCRMCPRRSWMWRVAIRPRWSPPAPRQDCPGRSASNTTVTTATSAKPKRWRKKS